MLQGLAQQIIANEFGGCAVLSKSYGTRSSYIWFFMVGGDGPDNRLRPIRLSITVHAGGLSAPPEFASALASWQVNSSEFFSASAASRKVQPSPECLPTYPAHVHHNPHAGGDWARHSSRAEHENSSRMHRFKTCQHHPRLRIKTGGPVDALF